MATTNQNLICGNCVFYDQFDSANLAKVEQVKLVEASDNESREADIKFSTVSNNTEDKPDYEFNVWTKHDCHGTEYQNNNRTWFYFGVRPNNPGVCLKFNVVNLNRQSKMFSQGMCPVFKTVPGHPNWERIRDKPTYAMDQKGSEFTLSFVYRTPDNPKAISYLAFTYPFTYQDLQNYLNRIDNRMTKRILLHTDDIYYHRECAIKTLEGRRLDVLTISSFHNITTEREDRLTGMFPDIDDERSFKFRSKKVVFMSARVHPGETPSSFVFNGFLNFLLNRDDPTAVILRRIYVFKLIPMLNPDGVARGHYRMDTRGVNLNRVYLEPSLKEHPTIFAARSLIRYYHNYYEIVDESLSRQSSEVSDNINLEASKVSPLAHTSLVTNVIRDTTNKLLQQVTLMTLDETNKGELVSSSIDEKSSKEIFVTDDKVVETVNEVSNKQTPGNLVVGQFSRNPEDSGLFLYIDMHGHASKKGVFMYGNYFDDPEDTIMSMLLPKLMSMNNPNFHFTSCSFAERNMYLIDKRDGMSREGSGRVAVYKLTGLVRSYTLECNYNSGRLVNTLPARLRDGSNKTPSHMFVPPKYTPTVFEEVGAALGPSILDLTNNNPNSRLPNSQYRSLRGVKSFLKLTCVNNHSASINRPRNKGGYGLCGNSEVRISYIPKRRVTQASQIAETSISSIKSSNALRRCSEIMKFSCSDATTHSYPDNSGTIAKEASHRTEDIVNPMNYVSPMNENNSTKIETNNTIKPRIVRRTTSIYAAVKRMKSSKKSRHVVNRKCTKNQRKINAENGNIVKSTRLSNNVVKTKIRKSIGFQASISTNNIQNIGTKISTSTLSRTKRQAKRTNVKTLSIEQTALTSEQTSVVKQGTKRLKIVSPRIVKTRPEIGESSKTTTTTTTTTMTNTSSEENPTTATRIGKFRNKQSAKSTFGRSRKNCLKNDTKGKTRKTAKLKAKI